MLPVTPSLVRVLALAHGYGSEEREAVGGRDLLPAPALLMAAPRRQRTPDRNAFRARCQLNYSAPVTRDLVHRTL